MRRNLAQTKQNFRIPLTELKGEPKNVACLLARIGANCAAPKGRTSMAEKPKVDRSVGLQTVVTGAKQVNVRDLLRRKMRHKVLSRRGPRGHEVAQIFRLP